jgi:hypothetical protein
MVWWSGKADKKIDQLREHNMTGDTSGGAHADDLNDGWHANAPDKVINVTQETFIHEWEYSLGYANCADCWINADRSYTKNNRTIRTWRTTIVTGKDGRLVNKHTTVIGRYKDDWNLGDEGTLKNHRAQYKWEDRGLAGAARPRTLKNFFFGYIKPCKRIRSCLRGIGPGGCVLRWDSNIYTCIVLLTSRCCGVLYLELTGHTIMMQCCHVKEYEEHTKFYLHNAKYTSKSLLLDCVDMVKLAGGYSVATGQWYQLRHQDTIFWQSCKGITSGYILDNGLSGYRYLDSYVQTNGSIDFVGKRDDSQAECGLIVLFVKTLNGRTVTIEISLFNTIMDIKQLLSKKMVCSPEDLRLG